jgi:RHS repeat-associated protein
VIATDYSGNARTNQYQLVVTNSAGAFTLQYDANGNLTNDGNGLVYEYDAADRTTAIIRNATNRTEFAYDGLGRRVQVIEKQNGVALSTNKFVWCGTELCEERSNTGTTVTKRFLGQGEQISGTNYFFTRDHLGSVREMTDTSGAVRARYDYDPYGRRTKVAGDLAADFGYTGHFMLASQPDHTLTLYRLYRSDSGRWNSRDPLAEYAGLNLYAYVRNSPVDHMDPFGLEEDGYGASAFPDGPVKGGVKKTVKAGLGVAGAVGTVMAINPNFMDGAGAEA